MQSPSSSNKYKKRRSLPSTDTVLYASILVNFLLTLIILILTTSSSQATTATTTSGLRSSGEEEIVTKPMSWHGGHPAEDRPGSCSCGADKYCLCTPSMAIDLIISTGNSVWLVRRKDTNQLATMGGFVDVGETVESAVKRELKEEMGLDVDLHQIRLFGVYSDPRRDNRRHTASAVFEVQLDGVVLDPHAGDDVKDAQKVALNEIEKHEYFADHKTILLDYKKHVDGKAANSASDIARSLCHVDA